MDYSKNRNEFIEKFRQSNNNTLNDSKISQMTTQPFEGRWDYLHQLGKAKKSKFEQLRQVKEKDEFEKEMSQCTFNPRLNKSKQILNAKNSEQNVIQRQSNWNVKRNTKLEAVKNEKFVKEFGQCYFSPKIV
jgi:hypothetical protein